MEAILPDRETAKRNGWLFQVQWIDDGKPCFCRCGSGARADTIANELTRDGKKPRVFDLRELLQIH